MMSTQMFIKILKSKPHNSYYLDRYIKFINHYRTQEIKETYIECHHICPKAKDLFPEYKSFKTNPWNKIKLTLKQHYIAHLLLAKAYGRSQAYAVLKMYRKRKKTDVFNSRIYETLRKEEIEFYRSVNQGDNHWSRKPGKIHNSKTNHPKGMKGKTHSIEYRKYMVDINTGSNNPFYGQQHNQSTKDKLSKKTKSHRWFTDGVDNIKITNEEQFIPSGWYSGRTIDNPNAGKRWIHTNDKETTIDISEITPDGWIDGRAARIFINNGNEMKMIFKGSIIPSGWVTGRV